MIHKTVNFYVLLRACAIISTCLHTFVHAMDTTVRQSQASWHEENKQRLIATRTNLPQFFVQSTSLLELDKDTAYYRMLDERENHNFTQYHDLEHSYRTAQITQDILATSYGKNLNLTERQKLILYLAGRLHSIGRQGRHELFNCSEAVSRECVDLSVEERRQLFYNQYKENKRIQKIIHKFNDPLYCVIGFEMILGKCPYIMCDGSTFNFDHLFQELGISDDERKFIAVLVGNHDLIKDIRPYDYEKMQFLIEELDASFIEAYQEKLSAYRSSLQLTIILHIAEQYAYQIAKYPSIYGYGLTQEQMSESIIPFVISAILEFYKNPQMSCDDNSTDDAEDALGSIKELFR